MVHIFNVVESRVGRGLFRLFILFVVKGVDGAKVSTKVWTKKQMVAKLMMVVERRYWRRWTRLCLFQRERRAQIIRLVTYSGGGNEHVGHQEKCQQAQGGIRKRLSHVSKMICLLVLCRKIDRTTLKTLDNKSSPIPRVLNILF